MVFKYKSFVALTVCAAVVVLNQNCGQQSSFSTETMAQNHSASMLDFDLPESQARLGDRIYIASILADIFLPDGDELSLKEAISVAGKENAHIADYITENFSSAKDKFITKVINEFILTKVEEFHGLCSVVNDDEACKSKNVSEMKNAVEVQTIAPVSVTREGYRVSVCNLILQNDRAVLNMMVNAKGKDQLPMTESNIMDIYNLFYPEQEISQSAYSALVEVFESVVSELEIDKWRAVATPICHSSGWQVL